MRLNKKIRSIFAVLTLALASALPAQSHAVTNALYLTMDGSGSIWPSDFSLQTTGYVNALNTVFGTGSYWGTAIGVSVFSSGVSEKFAMQTIDDAADLSSLTTAIGAITQPGGLTAIGNAINAAASAIQAGFADAINKVIDVSTDGYSNTGASPSTAANAALANGITTNCIGIGRGANCNFETGFEVLVADYNGFEAALTRKLERELQSASEPAVAMLLALGLIGMGVARRRRTA